MDFGLIGLLVVFMCPMIFGAITFVFSHETTEKITKDRWEKFNQ